jgi:hypothetical protein
MQVGQRAEKAYFFDVVLYAVCSNLKRTSAFRKKNINRATNASPTLMRLDFGVLRFMLISCSRQRLPPRSLSYVIIPAPEGGFTCDRQPALPSPFSWRFASSSVQQDHHRGKSAPKKALEKSWASVRRGGGGGEGAVVPLSPLAQDLVSLLFRLPAVILQACVVSLSTWTIILPLIGRPSSSAYLSSLLSLDPRARRVSALRVFSGLSQIRVPVIVPFLKTVIFVIVMPANDGARFVLWTHFLRDPTLCGYSAARNGDARGNARAGRET